MKLIAAVLGAVLILAAPACSKSFDGKAARALVKDHNALVLDVRTDEEFNARHIDGAVHIPVDALQQRLGELADLSRPVIVYCQSGARSAKAAKLLTASGFTQVHDLGGIGNW